MLMFNVVQQMFRVHEVVNKGRELLFFVCMEEKVFNHAELPFPSVGMDLSAARHLHFRTAQNLHAWLDVGQVAGFIVRVHCQCVPDVVPSKHQLTSWSGRMFHRGPGQG